MVNMTRVHTIRSKATLLLISALAAAGCLVGAAPAHAAVGDLTCISTSSTSTFTPALRLQSQSDTVTFSNVLRDCTSTNGITLTGATTPNVVGTGSIDCLALGNLTGTGQFNWGQRQISNFTWETTGGLGASFIFSGTITSGPLAGDSFQGVAPPISLLTLTTCLTTGLASLTYDVVWTFF
jgi:hypothetical protein